MNSTSYRQYAESVVYHIYTRSFCDGDGDGIGDCQGIQSKLDYLQKLGVDSLLIEGLDEGLDALIAAAHDRGMRVLTVTNIASTAPTHPIFRKSVEEAAYRDYFTWKEGRGTKAPDHTKINGECVWKRQDNGLYVRQANGCPLLNWANESVRTLVTKELHSLLKRGVDGMLWDVRYLTTGDDMSDSAGLRTVQKYLKALAADLRSQAPLLLIADLGNASEENALLATEWADGVKVNAHWDVFRAMHHREPNIAMLKRTLHRWQLATHGRCGYALWWEDASTPRALSRFVGDYGNYRKEAACMLAVMTGLSSGTPTLYQGQEIGMVDYPYQRTTELCDPRLNRFSRSALLTKLGWLDKWTSRYTADIACDNARTAMQWTALLPNAGFSPATSTPIPVNPNYKEINAQSEFETDSGVWKCYQTIFALRRDPEIGPVLLNGTYTEYMQGNLYIYARSYKGMSILVVCNPYNKNLPFSVPVDIAYREATLLMANYDMPAPLGDVVLRPYECICYQLK